MTTPPVGGAAGAGAGTSGGAGVIVADHGALRTVTSQITGAGKTFDDTAASLPATGGTGVAEALVASMLADLTSASADVIQESDALAEAADACNARYQDSDGAVAERFLIDGATAGAR